MKEYQAYGKAGNFTAKTPRLAALGYFERFPGSRKCNVIQGVSDGHFFTVTYGRASDGNWPESYKDVTKKSAELLPDGDGMKNQTVISATLRNQDLIPAFLVCLHKVDEVAFARFLTPRISCPLVASWPWAAVHGRAWPADDNVWWESEEASEWCNSLIDELNARAPEGCYFGAHPGDGSDFGFWECGE